MVIHATFLSREPYKYTIIGYLSDEECPFKFPEVDWYGNEKYYKLIFSDGSGFGEIYIDFERFKKNKIDPYFPARVSGFVYGQDLDGWIKRNKRMDVLENILR